ncbi:hypothetical protein POVCU1_075600, partial [Plasmodium ovale curtisi]
TLFKALDNISIKVDGEEYKNFCETFDSVAHSKTFNILFKKFRHFEKKN